MKQITRDLFSTILVVYLLSAPFYLNIKFGFSMWWAVLFIVVLFNIRYKNDFPDEKKTTVERL